ncbi:MAG TPA: aldehyde-activating protein [Caulobacteraceae bacterium]|nr:aldehyde-activating protein [Caulobacteraceae bacterium]
MSKLTLNGSCHCGAVRVAFMPSMDAAELPLRACQCGFCRRHGARTTSDAGSSLHVTVAPGDIGRYRFGRRAVDAMLCRECGCYIGSFLTLDGQVIGTLNVAGTDLDGFGGRGPEPVSYDAETDEAKLARRKARWTPTILVEATPSA